MTPPALPPVDESGEALRLEELSECWLLYRIDNGDAWLEYDGHVIETAENC